MTFKCDEQNWTFQLFNPVEWHETIIEIWKIVCLKFPVVCSILDQILPAVSELDWEV